MLKILLTLLLCAGFIIGGCTKDKPEPAPVVQKEISFVVYRAAADGSDKLLPEKITMPANDKTIEENAVIALVSTKPQDARMDDVVPIGTKVLNFKVENGIAYVDFSKEIARRGQGSYAEMMMTYAIVNTLTEFPQITKVQILVEGEKVITFSGHMDLEEPLKRNATLL